MWLGGLFYSIGAAINLWVKFPLDFTLAFFGAHEVFHVFVIAGALCHFYFMIAVLIPYRRLPAYTPEETKTPLRTAVPKLATAGRRSGSAVNAEAH